METTILLSGFGGQGILFAGKFLVYVGMFLDKEVTWLPSYGPEMRGGTANCGVIISDNKIGSPIVINPDVLVCLNIPSIDKYESQMKASGKLFYDSSLIGRPIQRTDIEVFGIPATKLADQHGMANLANMIIMGKVIKETGICGDEIIMRAMKKSVPERKKQMFDYNVKAIEIGGSYV